MKPPSLLCRLAAVLLLSASGLLAADAIPPTVITSLKVEIWSTDTETTSDFAGSVVVTGNNIRITCDRLVVVASRSADQLTTLVKPDQFKSLLATGNVHIVQGDREVTCGRAEILPGEDKIVLTEEPVVFDHSGPWVATGERLILLRGERRIFGDKVKFSGPPVKDLGFDKAKEMQPPAPLPAPAPSK